MAEGVLDRAFGGLVREGEPIDSLAVYSAMLEAIPAVWVPFPAELGETLETIAQRFNITVEVLAEANGITPRAPIRPGQILLVPGE